MSSFTPCFPPVILEKCLDIAKLIAQKKTGKATLEVNLGSSRFNFSCDNSFKIQTGPSRQDHWKKNTRKKSPSDYRRNARRLEKFLEEKRSSAHLVASAEQTSADTSTLSVISETPLIDNGDSIMDTEPGDQDDVVNTVDHDEAVSPTVPMITARSENTVNVSTHMSDILVSENISTLSSISFRSIASTSIVS